VLAVLRRGHVCLRSEGQMRLISVAQAAREFGIAEGALDKAIDSGLVKSVALVGNCGEIRTTK
jgi:hypothetical protein